MTDNRVLSSLTTTNFAGKNKILNGNMQIAQRGTSATSLTGTSYPTVDRWKLELASLGTWTMTQETDAPSGSEFSKSLKVLCTTANASPSSGAVAGILYTFEGQDVQFLKKGTSNAISVAVSFWVKSNVTGTYICELFDLTNTRQVSKSYVINTAGTWEYKTLIFPGDTSGAFTSDNNSSLRLGFTLAGGSTYTSGTLNTSWASNNNSNRWVGQTNLASATNNYLQLTGVQLEPGSVSTPFSLATGNYVTELAACQRYYYRHSATTANDGVCNFLNVGANGTTLAYGNYKFKTTMRTAPSLSASANTTFAMYGNGSNLGACTITQERSSVDSSMVRGQVTSGMISGYNYWIEAASNNTAYIEWSSEL